MTSGNSNNDEPDQSPSRGLLQDRSLDDWIQEGRQSTPSTRRPLGFNLNPQLTNKRTYMRSLLKAQDFSRYTQRRRPSKGRSSTSNVESIDGTLNPPHTQPFRI